MGFLLQYASRLIQMLKGPVERKIVKLLTPGTVTDEALLDPEENYLAGVYENGKTYGLAILVSLEALSR